MTTTFDNPFSPDWDDLFYNHVDPRCKRVVEFRKWLFRHKETEVQLFHGTASTIAVMDEGLKPTSMTRRRSLQSTSGFVYLSVFPGMAETFGRLGWPQSDISVYAVTVTIRKLKVDKDQLFNKRLWSKLDVDDSLVHSLVFGYGARVKGKIWPYQIKDTDNG